MGDPIKPNTPVDTQALNVSEFQNPLPTVPTISEPINEIQVQPTIQAVIPAITPEKKPEPPILNIEPIKPPETVVPTVESPKVIEPTSVPLPEVTSQPLTKPEEPIIPKVDETKAKKRILVVLLAILTVIIIITISVFLIKSNTPPIESNIVSAPVEDVVSHPAGFFLKNFEGRLYNVSFKYTSELGTASDTTSKVTYPSVQDGDCNIENITFSGDRDLSIDISTGHCEGGGTIPNEYSKVTSKDGKSFFIVVKKLDETLFPGMYTITASLGDSEGNFSPAITGVHIDAIRVKDLEKYKKYIVDIISTLTVELSPLKSENFDSKSNI